MRRKDIPKSQIRRVRPPPQSARKPRYVAPRCARGRGNVVCIDHGVFLHRSGALSVVRQRLRQCTRIVFQPRSSAAASGQPAVRRHSGQL